MLFPPGTFWITSVGLRPGIRYSGYGATLKRPPNQGRSVRTFNAAKEGYLYSGDEDSPPVTIEGFVFDGSRADQGKYDDYELEQAHLLFLMADPSKPGRLRARVRDCHFKDGVADAVSVYTNVDVQVSDCSAVDCFRGGLVVTGGHTRAQVANFTASGKTHPTGIDVEVDGPGHGGTLRVELTLNNVMLPDGDFDVGVSHGSVVLASNVVAAAPFYLYGGGDSTVRYGNCVIGVGGFSDYANRIVNPGDARFSDCVFYVDAEAPADEPPAGKPAAADEPAPARAGAWACAHVFWWVSSEPPPARQSVTFTDCEFRAGPGVKPSDTAYAVFAEPDRTDDKGHTVLTVDGGRVSEGFDYGVYLKQGGTALVKDVEIAADTALHLGSQPAYALDVTLDGLRADAARAYLHAPGGAAENRVAHRGVTLDEAANVLGPGGGLTGSAYSGGRVILGRSSPGAATHGLPGDVYRLRSPMPGATLEWICTTGGTGDGAVWRPLTAVE